MSLRGRPLWFEGQLIRPQHLQQMQRWIEASTEQRIGNAYPLSWGVHTLKLDPTLLLLGKVGLEQCIAIMPDGTPVDLPAREGAPVPLSVPADIAGRLVRLAVPARGGDGMEVGSEASRFLLQQQDARDTTGAAPRAQVQIGLPRLHLMLEGQPDDDLVTLPVARVLNTTAAGGLMLDDSFIPPSLRLGAHARFAAFAREAAGMLSARANVLAAHVDPARAGNSVAGMIDFALLQLINATEPVFTALAQAPDMRPVELYWEGLRLAGALATFSRSQRRPAPLPEWRHEQPAPTLAAITRVIREALGALSVEAAIALPLQPRAQGIWISPIADRALLNDAAFVLAVAAAVDPERIRTLIPAQAKMGPAEAILDLVNLQLPGIGLRPMPVAPTEIPYRTGTVYFELDRSGELWRALQTSPALVLHIGSELPDLTLEFWAIRRN